VPRFLGARAHEAAGVDVVELVRVGGAGAAVAFAADGTVPSDASFTSAPPIELFFTFCEVTAFLLSWLVPTLFLGSVIAA
jgi:hypothetical protein